MTGIFSAPSIEEAKQKAADAFGVPAADITFTILEEPKRSLLGGLFGKKEEYRIEASYVPVIPDEDEGEGTTEYAIPANEEEQEPETEAAEEQTVSETTEDGKTEVSPELMLEKMAAGAAYLENVLSKLAPGVTCEGRLENGIFFELKGENAGSLIGRRGDTLDALQYLTSMIANRGDKDYVRLTIDTCGYREKRRKALQELAQRISKSVLKTGRSIVLEPISRVFHRIQPAKSRTER